MKLLLHESIREQHRLLGNLLAISMHDTARQGLDTTHFGHDRSRREFMQGLSSAINFRMKHAEFLEKGMQFWAGMSCAS